LLLLAGKSGSVKMQALLLIGLACLASVSAKICWQNCSGMSYLSSLGPSWLLLCQCSTVYIGIYLNFFSH
jgi:hypothetical protein